MSIAEAREIAEILERIKAWSVPSRVTLARSILESVEGAPVVEPPPRRLSAREIAEMLRIDAPPPTDEEYRAILEDELIKKHLK